MARKLTIEKVERVLVGALRILLFKKRETDEGVHYEFAPFKLLPVILFIWGLTFPVFFLEEADQKITFANFYLVDAGRWDLIADNLRQIERIRGQANFWNNSIGWTHPVSYQAYDSYFNIATPAYLRSMWAMVELHNGDNQGPVMSPWVEDGGAVPETPIALASWGNIAQPPEMEGAIHVEEAFRWAETEQEIQIIVPCLQFERSTTGSGGAQGALTTHTNFKLLSWTPSVIDEMAKLRGKWVIVSGEIVRWEMWNEIIIGSVKQILEVADLFE